VTQNRTEISSGS